MTDPPLLSAFNLSRSYGSTAALRDVSLHVRHGEMLGVLGQNGAGKSTLVKILAGVVRPDEGSVEIEGEPQHFHSARDALRRGLVLIPQELAYVPELTVAENIVLGDWGARRSMVSLSRMREVAAPFAKAVGLTVSLKARMSRLSLAECQLVEIAKALNRNARVLLLDEPTAALSTREAQRLFGMLKALRSDSRVGMIYISHRLDEVVDQTDRVVVLRDGVVADARATSGATRTGLIHSMLGHLSLAQGVGSSGEAADATVAISLRNVSHRTGGLQDVSCDIRSGEIVGLFGPAGGGHEILARTLGGLRPHEEGKLLLGERVCGPLKTPRQARSAGIIYVPSDRKTQGLVLRHSVRHNLTFPQLSRYARRGLVSARLENALVSSVARRYDLRFRGAAQAVGQLSGGNQQKVMLASRVEVSPGILVIQEPTRGVDVGAREDIFSVLSEVAKSGRSILFATSDAEEAVALSDRLLVFRAGRLVASLDAEEKTQAKALEAAGGGEA